MGKPERILWVDVETTGLDQEVDIVIEIGAVLTDLDGNPTNVSDGHLSELLLAPNGSVPFVPPEVAAINHFDPLMWRDNAIMPETAFELLAELMDESVLMGAKNTPFDKGFIERDARAARVKLPKTANYNWLDVGALIQTRLWMPGFIEKPKLELAAAYLGLEEQQHRAVADALLASQVYRLLKPAPYDAT